MGCRIACVLLFLSMMTLSSVSSDFKISVIAGNNTIKTTGTGGPVSSATFNFITNIWKDTLGFMYVAEKYSNCVRRFLYPDGIVSVVAGICDVNLRCDDVPAKQELFRSSATSSSICIESMAVDLTGKVYLATFNQKYIIYVKDDTKYHVTGDGRRSTEAGDGGAATSATIFYTIGLWVDTLNQLYLSSLSSSIRKIDINGIITTVAGARKEYNYMSNHVKHFVKRNVRDVIAATSFNFGLNQVQVDFLFVDTLGQLYLSDNTNHVVRLVDTFGLMRTIAGTGLSRCRYVPPGDIPATSCPIKSPRGIVVDPKTGNIYIVSGNRKRIVSLNRSTGLISTFAGDSRHNRRKLWKVVKESVCNLCFDGNNGPATSALIFPNALFLDTDNRLFASSDSRIVWVNKL